MSWSFNQILKAIDFINNNHENLPSIMKGRELETIINEKQTSKAKELIQEFNLNILETKLILAK